MTAGLPRHSAAETGLPRHNAAETGLPRRSVAETGATRLFHFALHAKMKKRDIRFENEEVQKGKAKTCLHSGKVERLHGNTGGF